MIAGLPLIKSFHGGLSSNSEWNGLISVTHQFNELYWNHYALMIHGSDKSYPLHYLSIDGPHRELDDDDNTYTFHLVHDRTKDVVCSLRVDADDTQHYLALQKAVINAKLPKNRR